jgi:hypothetical protein
MLNRAKMVRAVVVGLAVTAASCMPSTNRASLQQLQMRAAFDMACRTELMRTYHVDERTTGVEGCGRRLTYIESCEIIDGINRCTWVLDAPRSFPWALPGSSPATIGTAPQTVPSMRPPEPHDPLHDRI